MKAEKEKRSFAERFTFQKTLEEVPIAFVTRCPLYEWERQPERAPVAGWVTYAILFGLMALLVLQNLGDWDFYRIVIIGFGSVALILNFAIWEWRSIGTWNRWREKGGLRDLYLSGHRPTAIVAAYSKARRVQLLQRAIPAAPSLLIIFTVMLFPYLDVLTKRSFMFIPWVLPVGFMAVHLSTFHGRGKTHRMTREGIYGFTARQQMMLFLTRMAQVGAPLSLLIIPMAGMNAISYVFGVIALVYALIFLQFRLTRFLRNISRSQFRGYLDAWFREDEELMEIFAGKKRP